MHKFTVIIEKSEDGYCASVPILPGCVAMADNKADVEQLIYEGILFHLEGMKEEGLEIPVETETEVKPWFSPDWLRLDTTPHP